MSDPLSGSDSTPTKPKAASDPVSSGGPDLGHEALDVQGPLPFTGRVVILADGRVVFEHLNADLAEVVDALWPKRPSG